MEPVQVLWSPSGPAMPATGGARWSVYRWRHTEHPDADPARASRSPTPTLLGSVEETPQ